MAAVATGPLSSLLTTKDETARERDLFRYFRPDGAADHANQEVLPSGTPSGPPTSPDDHLTALAQLVALRMNTKRCIISVIHGETSYILAESTRTSWPNRTCAEGDELFFGCSTFRRTESMCDHVVATTSPSDPNPLFVVPDMSKDARFRDRPFVHGGPRFMFYAGACLRTAKGTRIGAVAAADDVPRDGVSEDQKSFMLHVSKLVMDHLEYRREAEEKNKLQRMSRGLNAFIEGKDNIPFAGSSLDIAQHASGQAATSPEPSQRHVPDSAPNGYHSTAEPSQPEERPTLAPRPPTEDSTLSDVSTVSHDGAKEPAAHLKFEQIYSNTLSRAARLLWESLSLQATGGVLFFDTTMGTTNISANLDSPESQEQSNVLSDFDVYSVNVSGKYSTVPAEVLAQCFGSCGRPSDMEEDGSVKFRPMCQEAMRRIVKRYPKGKLWAFDDDWAISSSEDEMTSPNGHRHSIGTGIRKQAEARLLQYCFPGARQLVLLPIWDATDSRHSSACFAFTSSPLQCFYRDVEFMLMTVISNSITSDVSRLATLDADKKKLDFLGSISHELRSPLHGILASAEFLAESKCDMFQARLVDTIDVCGRTLLDEINHILEFSRINSFERSRKVTRNSKAAYGQPDSSLDKGSPALPGGLSVLGNTNVAAVTEVVSEGVVAGRGHPNFSAVDMCDMSQRGQSRDVAEAFEEPLSGELANEKGVDVVLDFAHLDYTCVMHSGAYRRIVMNLFTNALKYTNAGMIHVKLRIEETGDQDSLGKARETIVLTMRDTGRGISSSYLRTHLFTPFAQENSLAPGTGLGLSMVRSIVTMLNGTINVKSKLGGGTEVRVVLPILPPTKSGSSSSSIPNSVGSAEKNAMDSVNMLRSATGNRKVALCGFNELSGESQQLCGFQDTIKAYVTKWYGFECDTYLDPSQPPEVVILPERSTEAFFQGSLKTDQIPVIVLSNGLHHDGQKGDLPDHAFFLSKPIGPYRLAKAIQACLDQRAARTPTGSGQKQDEAPAKSPYHFEGISLGSGKRATPVLAHSGSENAQMVVSPAVEKRAKEHSGFPFPTQDANFGIDAPKAVKSSIRPSFGQLRVESKTDSIIETMKSDARHDLVVPTSKHGVEATAEAPSRPPAKPATGSAKRLPSLLLVEDNKINLMLLQTFMKKRKYRNVDKAENGQLAVEAAQSRDYDIIFMDISMPVMNGFQATREIRAMEQRRQRQHARKSRASLQRPPTPSSKEQRQEDVVTNNGEGGNTHEPEPPPPPALIIALTGLAGSADQREAITSGVDVYMTKPVSFKEVGQLLDNWESNGGRSGLEVVAESPTAN